MFLRPVNIYLNIAVEFKTHKMNTNKLYQQLENLVESLQQEFGKIPESRKKLLASMASYLKEKKTAKLDIKLNYICTHNSRRSHISQIWSATAAYRIGWEHIQHFSGGTEATAFNPRAIAAMQRAGFQINVPEFKNPHCLVHLADKYVNVRPRYN